MGRCYSVSILMTYSIFLTTTILAIYSMLDRQIYIQVPFNQLEEGINQLSAAAQAVSDWAGASDLRLNPGKTQAIFFTTERKVHRINRLNLPGIALGSGVLSQRRRPFVPFAEKVMSLGIVLDRTLSWKRFFDHISLKVNRVLYSLRFFRSSTTELLRQRMARALIFPLLDYCSVLTNDATYEQRCRLQRLQNSCLRYIFRVRQRDHVTPLRRRLGWLRTDTRRQYFTAVLLYKVLYFSSPSYLRDMFEMR